MKLLTTLLAAAVLAACAGAPTPPADPLAALPTAFKEAAPVAGATASAANWWLSFDDAVLNGLIERADANNQSLRIAAARLAQARALLRGAEAERQPQLQLDAGAARESGPLTGYRPTTRVSVGASLAYEIDVAGRLSGLRDAAGLDAREREALLQDARLLVHAEVARSYFALRALDDEQTLVRDTVRSYADSLALTERRLAAGDVPEFEAARVRSELAANEAEAFALERQRRQMEHALSVLVGEPASRFAVAPIVWQATLPQVPPGVPSTVLERRPDITAARNALLAAQLRAGVAQSAWWPTLALTAAAGQSSPELSDLLRTSARTWGLGALLSLPLLDGGRREAGIARAQAEVDAVGAQYREQVLVALRSVEDELAAVRLLSEQNQAQARAVNAAARVSALAGTRYRNGFVSQLDLLDAQRSELRSRRQALQVRAAQYQAAVGLIRALGGGWESS